MLWVCFCILKCYCLCDKIVGWRKLGMNGIVYFVQFDYLEILYSFFNNKDNL